MITSLKDSWNSLNDKLLQLTKDNGGKHVKKHCHTKRGCLVYADIYTWCTCTSMLVYMRTKVHIHIQNKNVYSLN